eukprot:6210472-Pleurochrysis_carterae.AAC.1
MQATRARARRRARSDGHCRRAVQPEDSRSVQDAAILTTQPQSRTDKRIHLPAYTKSLSGRELAKVLALTTAGSATRRKACM